MQHFGKSKSIGEATSKGSANKGMKRIAQKTGFPLMPGVEAVEKVPKQILGRDAETSDFIECTTINDLMLGKGQ